MSSHANRRTNHPIHGTWCRHLKASLLTTAVLIGIGSGPIAMAQSDSNTMNIPGLGNMGLDGVSMGPGPDAAAQGGAKDDAHTPSSKDEGGYMRWMAGKDGIDPHAHAGMGSFQFVVAYRNDLLNELAMVAMGGKNTPTDTVYDSHGTYMHTRKHEDPGPPLVKVDGVRMKGLTGPTWYENPRAIWNAAPETIAVMDTYDDESAVRKYGPAAKYGAVIITTIKASKTPPKVRKSPH